MDLLVIFLTGLTTGGISCLAMQMGLLTSALTQSNSSQNRFNAIVLFLGTKVIAYTLLGSVLGSVGSILVPSLNAQLFLQFIAALYMLVTALHLLNVHPIFRYFVIQPPKFVGKLLKKTKQSESLFTPALLGGLTVLVPCGVTQAMMLVAVSSGDALAGAFTMLAFTLGTTPIFFAIGLGLTSLSSKWQTQFTRFAAIVLISLSMYSFNGLLRVFDSPLAFQNWGKTLDKAALGIAGQEPEQVQGISNDAYVVQADGKQQVVLEVHANGYEPNSFTVKKNIPVELKLVTNGVYSCANSFTFKKFNIFKQLKPTDQQTVTFTPSEKGQFAFSCAMGMYGGTMRVI